MRLSGKKYLGEFHSEMYYSTWNLLRALKQLDVIDLTHLTEISGTEVQGFMGRIAKE